MVSNTRDTRVTMNTHWSRGLGNGRCSSTGQVWQWTWLSIICVCLRLGHSLSLRLKQRLSLSLSLSLSLVVLVVLRSGLGILRSPRLICLCILLSRLIR